VKRAADLLSSANRPIVLAGPGVARDDASDALLRFAERLKIPVVTTFLGKGVFPDDHELAVGTIGFMVRDYANFGFEHADVVVAVGYDLVEYPPVRWNPDGSKRVIHVHRDVAEVDASYVLSVGVVGNIGASLDAIALSTDRGDASPPAMPARGFREEELAQGARDDSFPLRPQRIVADVRTALDRQDIVLVDTGAAKMWMARLYPTYAPNTCLISNGLATMAFSLPGAIAAKLVHPERRVLAVMGDGAFLMSAAEIETAVREGIGLTVLVWVDGGYGLIGWKQDLLFARTDAVSFGNPDFVRFAESFGAHGYTIASAGELLPTLRKAIDDDGVSIVACPVDYGANARLVDRLGGLADHAGAS
jgi:acetolactate synthase-1/2/3 large subunit